MTTLLLAAGVFVLAGVVQALSGFGSALVSVPLLAVVLGPAEAIVLSVLVAVVLSSWAAVREREHVEVRPALRLLLWALPGLPLGLLVLRLASEHTVTLLVGGVVIVAALLLGAGLRLPENRATHAGAGIVSGVLLTSTGLNGPPLVLALAGRSGPRATRATLQAVFAGQDLLALVGFALTGLLAPSLAPYAVAGIIGIRVGWALGGVAFNRLSPGGFDRVVRVVLLLSGLSAVASAQR